jgi:hypothetical protein
MLTYKSLRNNAKSGDVLMIEGRGWVSRLIRAFTGQSVSHVALLLWIGDSLFVAEMKEFHGYRFRPASCWVEDALRSGFVFYGMAPGHIRMQCPGISDTALRYRNKPYSYTALFRVWWAQITRSKVPGGLVCSTFVQRVWEECGYQFTQTADPGDYLRLCDSVTSITTPTK